LITTTLPTQLLERIVAVAPLLSMRISLNLPRKHVAPRSTRLISLTNLKPKQRS
jgi:hypothetical protein